MNIAKTIGCKDFTCVDVDYECYMLPDIDVDPERIFIIMIAECAPEVQNDYFYAGNSALFEKTTVQAFNDAGADMLMGDAAIKSLNYIAKSVGERRVIPAGSTYKIRGDKYYFKERKVFLSYLQAGPSYFIEKSKRRMIAEDISEALNLSP